MDKYKIGKVLGDGTFGSVVKATNIQTGHIVAIKQMKKKMPKWDECVSQAEIAILMKLAHPNIIKLFEIIKENNQLYFVFEFMDQNVYQLMKDRAKNLTELEIRNVIYQTLQGLNYIHRHGYFHRDIKPENLLESGGIVKIGDFGLVKQVRAKPPYTEYVSTRWYRAPEVIMRSHIYNSPIDVFAVGAIMAEMFRNYPLFPGTSELDQINKICAIMGSIIIHNFYNFLFSGTPTKEEWPDGYKLAQQIGFHYPKYQRQNLKQLMPHASDDAIDLMNKLLSYNPIQRLSASQALQHPFFQCNIPITENIADQSIVMQNDNKEGIKAEKVQKMLQNEIISNYQEEKPQKKTLVIKSGFYMRSSRYQPGVNSIKIAKKE